MSDEKAKSIVTEPTLPHSIRSVMISLDTIDKLPVIPSVIPTVASAEVHSNSTDRRGILSILEIIIVEEIITVI